MRSAGWAMMLVLIGSMALPSLARKKKASPLAKAVVQQQDTLAPNDRKRFNYCFYEAARQHAAGNYSAAFDLFEHARQIDPAAAAPYFYLSL